MEKKRSHKKLLISGLALLSCGLIAGVGYAAWVIAASINTDTSNVSVHAPDVLEEAITIAYNDDATGSYVFGPLEAGGTYITTDSTEEDYESLSVTFSFNVVAANLGSAYDITLSLAGTNEVDSSGATASTGSGDYTALQYAINQGYILAPISSEVTVATISAAGEVTANSDDASFSAQYGNGIIVSAAAANSPASGYDVTVQAKFAWGSYFNYQNPVNWAPAEGYDDGTGATGWESKSNTISALRWLDAHFEGDSFVYTIGAEQSGS